MNYLSLCWAIAMAICMPIDLIEMSYLSFSQSPISYIAFVWCTFIFGVHVYFLENSAIKSRKSS